MTLFLLILGLVLFIGLVVVHEWGHFIMARRNGVEVEEFGIGFPPRAKVLGKKNGTVYTLNWLPLGGFVKLKGEHDADTKPGTFGAASLLAKIKIMTAGVVMNLLTAIVLLTLLALVGLPQLLHQSNVGEDQFSVSSDERIIREEVLVNYIEPNSPATRAGLKTSDHITNISAKDNPSVQKRIRQVADLRQITQELAGQQVAVDYTRNGKPAQTTVGLRSSAEVEQSLKTDKPKGYIGIGLADYQVNRYTWSAPVVAVGLTAQLTKLTMKGLGSALAGLGKMLAGLVTFNAPARQIGQQQATEQVSGPVGIFFVLQSGAHEGVVMVLFIIAIISLTLAIMNVLPIPALDGGRLFVTLAYRALKRPLTKTAEDRIHGTGFALLMLLFLLITVVDVGRFF
jgi:regulator of sigma E protease